MSTKMDDSSLLFYVFQNFGAKSPMITPINKKNGISMILDMLIFQKNNRIGTTWVFWRTMITKKRTKMRMMIVFVFMVDVLYCFERIP